LGEHEDPGSYRTPLYYRETKDLAGDLNLKPGEFLQARVVSLLPERKGSLLLNIRGTQVVAASKLEVTPGDALIVQVKSVAHPIELKIYAPQAALKKLSPPQLKKILSGMGLETSEQLLDIARRLLEENIHLDPELMEKTGQHWSELLDESGELNVGRFQALHFLSDNKFPVPDGLLPILGNVYSQPEEELTGAWETAVEMGKISPLTETFDLEELISALGIDLVNQLGRWPHRASKTLHARLLRKLNSSEKSSKQDENLLAVLLGLALANLKKERQFHLMLPLYEGGQCRFFRLFVQLGDIPEGWAEADWWAAGFLNLTSLGKLRFNVQRRKNKISLTFFSEKKETLKTIKETINRVKNILSKRGYILNIDYREKIPPALPDPFALHGEQDKEKRMTPGEVDLRA
jgi:hypothetical protein